MTLLEKLNSSIVPQKYAYHLVMFWRYWSLLKILNFVKTVTCYLLGTRHLSSYPPFLKIETTNRCCMGCKYCFVSKSDQEFFFDDYKKLMDHLSPYLFEVSLHDIGEPLLNKELIAYIHYARDRKVGTIMSTSLAVRKPDGFWEKLVTSGLDHLIVAIDGISQESYSKYRINGDIQLVFKNLEKLIRLRKTQQSKLLITWQMINFEWNEHEHIDAQKLALDMGCDSFKLIQDEFAPRRNYYLNPIERTRNCLMPFLMFIVRADGKVRPCCNIYLGIADDIKEDNLVADIKMQNFDAAWNSPQMRDVRNKKSIGTRDYCRHCREM